MKFGKRLEQSKHREWSQHYFDYRALKKALSSFELQGSQSAVNSPETKPVPASAEEVQLGRKASFARSSYNRSSFGSVGISCLLPNEHRQNNAFSDMFAAELQKVLQFYDEKLTELQDRFEFYAAQKNPKGSLGTVESDDEDDDFDNNPVGSEESERRILVNKNRKRIQSSSLKQAYTLVYQEAIQLQNFGILNYTAGVKILKKYIKACQHSADEELSQMTTDCCSQEIDSVRFHTQVELLQLHKDIEATFAKTFCDGDVQVAKGSLLVKLGTPVDWELFTLGLRFGMMVMVMGWFIWDSTVDQYLRYSENFMDVYEFPIYKCVGCMLLAVWCWGLLLHIWGQVRINYMYIFEMDPRYTSSAMEVWRFATSLTWWYLLNMLIFNKVRRNEIPHMAIPIGVWPTVLVVYVSVRIGFALHRSHSFYKCLWAVVTSPFSKVTFYGTFLGDWLTSLVKVGQDYYFTLVYILSGRFLVMQNGHADISGCPSRLYEVNSSFKCVENSQRSDMDVWILPVISILPLWWRMQQNLRKYRDEQRRWPFLGNAAKYQISASVALFGAFSPSLYNFAGTNIVIRIFFLMAVTTSTLYTYYWDIYNDWALGKLKYGGLRETRMYSKTYFYYTAMALDLFLRFTWTLTLIPHDDTNPFGKDFTKAMNPILAAIEIGRRTMWACLRLENEHLHNMEGYRRVTFIPLYFDAPEDDDNTKQHASIRSIIEIAIFVLVVVTLGTVAILYRD